MVFAVVVFVVVAVVVQNHINSLSLILCTMFSLVKRSGVDELQLLLLLLLLFVMFLSLFIVKALPTS